MDNFFPGLAFNRRKRSAVKRLICALCVRVKTLRSPVPSTWKNNMYSAMRKGWMDGYFVYRRSTLKGHIASNKFYVI